VTDVCDSVYFRTLIVCCFYRRHQSTSEAFWVLRLKCTCWIAFIIYLVEIKWLLHLFFDSFKVSAVCRSLFNTKKTSVRRAFFNGDRSLTVLHISKSKLESCWVRKSNQYVLEVLDLRLLHLARFLALSLSFASNHPPPPPIGLCLLLSSHLNMCPWQQDVWKAF